jgi:hypothetical protein
MRGTTLARKKEMSMAELLDVNVEIVYMTPELAAELLELNTRNRKLKPTRVDSLVRELQDGEWRFNGDAVRVSNDARLLDGQHRLEAVVQSGITAPMLLIEGIQEDAQATIDAGLMRTYADHLRINGEERANRLAGIVRLYAAYLQSKGKDRWNENKFRLSIGALDRVLEKNPKLRQSAENAVSLYKNGKVPIQESVGGVADYVLHRIDGPDAQFFFERLSTGTKLYESGPTQPILKLREYIMSPRDTVEHRRAYVNLGAVFKAWNAYREGRTVSNVALRVGGSKPEKFPWPK